MPNDYFVSLIRTWVPVAVGAVLAWVAARTGIVLDEASGAAATVTAVGVLTAVYYAVARLLEARWPMLGRILIALGLSKAAPEYYRYTPTR